MREWALQNNNHQIAKSIQIVPTKTFNHHPVKKPLSENIVISTSNYFSKPIEVYSIIRQGLWTRHKIVIL